jgi:Ca2+-binding RTX toxin-like protein
VTYITDYEYGTDSLNFALIADGDQSGSLALRDTEDGTGAELYLGSQLVAVISGAQGLSLDDINIASVSLEAGTADIDYSIGDEALSVRGNGGNNLFEGGAGDDSICGGLLYVSPQSQFLGEDTLIGGDGDDFIQALGATIVAPHQDAGYPGEVVTHLDILDGGAGNDTLCIDNGGTATGGEGEDEFRIEQYINFAESAGLVPPIAEITDYDRAEDVIVVNVGPVNGTIVTVAPDEDGTGSNILSDGVLIAHVAGVSDLTVDELTFSS